MIYYFAWLKEKEPFSPEIHCRHDEEIFYLEIHHKSGGFPLADVVISPSKKGGGYEAPYALLSWDWGQGPQVGFYGRLLTMPLAIEGEYVRLQFTAEPEDSQAQLSQLHEQLKDTPHWDPLFVPQSAQGDPRESLESRSALYEWSRTSGQVTLSSLFQGAHSIDLGENFKPDSLKIRLTQVPLSSVKVTLKAEWIQHAFGQEDIAPLIASHFPHGQMSTLTPEHFKMSWPGAGVSLGRSGYGVMRSQLVEKFPSGSLDLPQGEACQTPPFWHEEGEKGKPSQSRLPRAWFSGVLQVGWLYRQKRREVVTFTLFQKTQPLGPFSSRQRSLGIALQPVGTDFPLVPWSPQKPYQQGQRVLWEGKVYTCQEDHGPTGTQPVASSQWGGEGLAYGLTHPAQASFFNTDRGRHAIGHALDCAKAHLVATSRAVELTVTGQWQSLSSLSTDHTLSLVDPRLPGGRASGKVVSYKMVADGQKGDFYVTVTIACALGEGPQLHGEGGIGGMDSYGEEGVMAGSYGVGDTAFYETEEGVKFMPYEHQSPKEGVLHPYALRGRDILSSITLAYPASDQIEYLEENQYPKTKNIRALLRQIPTKLKLQFRSLKTRPLLEHHIHIEPLTCVSSPKDVALGGSFSPFPQEDSHYGR
jgi:hypothetical protein